MAGILNAIWCYLQDFLNYFNDYAVRVWDGMLGLGDAVLLSFPALTVCVLDPTYTWLLGATGISQAIAIVASALVIRFTLQSVPFVRWGS